MNSKILLIIIVLIVAFGAFTFLADKNKNIPSSTQPTIMPSGAETNNQDANVILGDSGFVPKDITVKAGIKVVWINKSGKTATVNSDNHPTHLLYPFLNLGEFANSSVVQTVFDKPGRYSYHNHLNPNEKGSVTVE